MVDNLLINRFVELYNNIDIYLTEENSRLLNIITLPHISGDNEKRDKIKELLGWDDVGQEEVMCHRAKKPRLNTHDLALRYPQHFKKKEQDWPKGN